MNKNVEHAIIEIPLGSKNKYELDKETGRIHLDRVLYASMIYPAEYGIIETHWHRTETSSTFWLFVLNRLFPDVLFLREFSVI